MSAHVMGGAMMGKDASRGVVNADGACWGMRNLSVLDGSVFPTSIGANPQLSVYALALRNATKLAQTWATDNTHTRHPNPNPACLRYHAVPFLFLRNPWPGPVCLPCSTISPPCWTTWR
ncbi:MAG: GMC family oxidoreductase [Rivihabitans pingtungensis]